MKKTIFLLICFLLFMPCSVSASSQSSYDYRKDNIEDSDEYNDIQELDKKLDYTKAVKTYNYTPNELLDIISNDTLISSIQSNTNYSWKVPIITQNDNYDYAIISKRLNGKLSYDTAKTTSDGAKQVYYIFNKNLISDLLNSYEMNDFHNLYALSISQLNMDLIVIDKQSTVSLIPFASRADLLEINNGSLYTPAKISDLVNKYIEATSNNTFSTHFIYIAISLVVVVAFIIGTLIIKRKQKQGIEY